MNKKSIFSILFFFLSVSIFAKKVKFSVDMTGQTISSAGVHIMGDFQSEAGLGADFAQLTPMTLEFGNVYSIIVNIPAFRKYEYKFANGDLFYEVEFVPVESRVGYDFDDNRWMYVDSLKNDTTFVGSILYGTNAPAGLMLVRPLVDMSAALPVNANGIHIAGSFQAWNPTKNTLYSFGDNIYETIFYVANATYEFKYYNGNNLATTETVPVTCATNNNRSIAVTTDTVLNTVCYSSCTACLGTSIKDNVLTTKAFLSPNPSTDKTTLQFNDNQSIHDVTIMDVTGKVVRSYSQVNQSSLTIDKNELGIGMYFIKITAANSALSIQKILFN